MKYLLLQKKNNRVFFSFFSAGCPGAPKNAGTSPDFQGNFSFTYTQTKKIQLNISNFIFK